jgi:hypothetical protein
MAFLYSVEVKNSPPRARWIVGNCELLCVLQVSMLLYIATIIPACIVLYICRYNVHCTATVAMGHVLLQTRSRLFNCI